MYRALIFDFDYTLGDTTQSISASINYALEKLGYAPHGVEEIRKTIGFPLSVAFRMLTGVHDERLESLFFDHFQVKADEVMTKDARLYPGAEELLRGDRPVAIVSTKHRFRIEDILRKFDLQNAVKAVVGNEDVSREKPDPEGLLLAARLLGVGKKEALYVGDSVVDAEAAERAGMDFAAVLTGTTPREAFGRYPSVLLAKNIGEVAAFLAEER